MRLLPILFASLLALQTAAAQHPDPAVHHGRPTAAGEAGLPTALSADERDGLLQGRGMGLARAAERNGYPGPLHVLELADSLALTPEQRASTERLRADVLAQARPLGAAIVAAERHLDRLFEAGNATADQVDRMTAHLGRLRGQLRAVHLRAHVAQRAILTPRQVATYHRLRGHSD